MGAQVLVENCYFSNTKKAMFVFFSSAPRPKVSALYPHSQFTLTRLRMNSITDLDSDEDGYAIDKNNVFVNSSEEITQVGSLTPPYSYT